MRATAAIVLALALALAVAGCAPAGPDRGLVVFAAASLEDAVVEMGATRVVSGSPPPEVHSAGSGTLVTQVLAGAPADVVLLAGPAPAQRLRDAGRAAETVAFAGNRLVLVVPRGSTLGIASLADLARARHVAIADPDLAPAGAYALAWLEAAGVRAIVEPLLVPMADVRAALAAVATGHADAGVVYASDAATTDRVEVVVRAAPGEGPAVTYVAVVLAGPREDAARRFVEALRGAEGQAVLARHGFTPVGSP